MNTCKVSSLLAYIASIYIISCIIYLIITKKYGTPFNNALQKYPELIEIKEKSSKQRLNAFYNGLLISIVVVVILKPFGNIF